MRGLAYSVAYRDVCKKGDKVVQITVSFAYKAHHTCRSNGCLIMGKAKEISPARFTLSQ